MIDNNFLDSFIQLAVQEDIGDGDHTTLATIPEHATGKVKLFIKQEGVLAGLEMAGKILEYFDPQIEFIPFMKDGHRVSYGDIAFTAKGEVHALLQAERLLLNIMQRMSGIATETKKYTDQLKGLHTRILDTRKTTPGFRYFEKMAVAIGGGVNHRFGLYDMILIKDNHIDFSGGIENALKKTSEYLKKQHKELKIEVEARTLDDVEKILAFPNVHRILFDNFSIQQTKEAVQLVHKKMETESSGGITFSNIRKYAECGVDYISVGALTHQVKSLDMSLKATL